MSKGGSGWRRWSDNEEVHLNLDLDRESWSPWNNTIVLDLRIGTMRGYTQRTHYFPAQRRTCAQIHFEWAAKIARSEYGAQWEKFRFCNCDCVRIWCLIDFYQTCLVIMCFLIPLISHCVTEIIIVCSQSLWLEHLFFIPRTKCVNWRRY